MLVARPPTNTFLLLGLCSWGTDFFTSICAADVQRVSSLPVSAATGSHPTRPRGSSGPQTAVRSYCVAAFAARAPRLASQTTACPESMHCATSQVPCADTCLPVIQAMLFATHTLRVLFRFKRDKTKAARPLRPPLLNYHLRNATKALPHKCGAAGAGHPCSLSNIGSEQRGRAADSGAAHRLLNLSKLCKVLQQLLLSCFPRQAPKEESTAARLCRCCPVARHCTSGPCINLTASSVDRVVAYPPLRTYPQQSSPLLSGLLVTLARAARAWRVLYSGAAFAYSEAFLRP